jgi:hypothetical protein
MWQLANGAGHVWSPAYVCGRRRIAYIEKGHESCMFSIVLFFFFPILYHTLTSDVRHHTYIYIPRGDISME